MKGGRSQALRYAVAVASIVVATWLRLAAGPYLQERVPFLSFTIAVVVSSLYGGRGPGLLAVLLGGLSATYLFIPPRGGLIPTDVPGWASLILFLFVGTLVVLLADWRRLSFLRLFEERERFIVTLSSIGDGVIVTDVEGRVNFLNPVAEGLTGWNQQEARGQPLEKVFEILSETTRERVPSPALRALQEGRIVGLSDQTILITKDRSERPIDDSAAPIRDQRGNVIGVVLVFRDVTERRKAENSLRESEQELSDFFENATIGLHWVGPGGIILRANQSELDMLGYERDEYVGHHISEFHVDQPVIDRILDCLKQGKEIQDYEARLRCKDGSIRHVMIHSNVLWKEGRFVHTRCFTRDVTARKQAEEALRESEKQLRLAMEAGRMGSWSWEIRTGRVQWSSALEEIHGLEPGTFPGTFEAFQEDMHPDDRERTLQKLQSSLTGGGEHHVEYRIVLPDGTVRWVEGRGQVVRDEAGEPLRLVGVCSDVTHRKELEQELRKRLREQAEAEERMRSVVDHVLDGIITIDEQATIQTFNPAAEKLFGYSAEEVIGRNVKLLMPEPYHSEHDEYVSRFLETGEARIIGIGRDVSARCKDGSIFPISLAVSQFDLEGNRYFTGIIHDMTEVKRNEATLQFLADASKSLATLVDYKSTLQRVAHLAVPGFANWCAIDMLTGEETLERVAVAHQDPDRMEIALQIRARYPAQPDDAFGPFHVLRTGEPEIVGEISDEMLQTLAKDEEHLRILRELGLTAYICVPLITHEKGVGTITFVQDEPGRRYGPEDLAVAEDLAHRAAVAIENARLYHEVREADRRKDEFLAMLAHELRNPLAPIRSGLDILAMDEGPQSETVTLMQEQVEHLVRLVDDLLDVSRIMRGRVDLRREPVELQTVVRRAADAVRGVVEDHGQSLEISLPEEPVLMSADPVRLIQVIENLLNNAAKYTDVGGRIELIAEADEEEVVVRVRDNGIGIEPELLPKVFDLFTQSSRSLDRAQGGLGIGLTLVKNLVQMHGGSVSASSPGSGKGSEFRIRLPRGNPAESLPAPAPEHVPVESRRIVVVDDNVGAARMLSLLLSRLGALEVEMAHDGRTALSVIEEFEPDMVLLDIGLPGMDGYEIARNIRRRPGGDRILLVALTGYGQAEDRQRSREAGFDEHLVKPPTAASIRDLMGHPKLAGQGEPRPDRKPSLPSPPSPSPSTAPTPPRRVAHPVASGKPALQPEAPPGELTPDERERLGEFLREEVHELGNILHMLRLILEVLSRDEDSRISPHIREMLDECPAMLARFLTPLRQLGGVLRGSLRPSWRKVDLTEVIPEAVSEVEPVIEQRRQQIDVRLPEESISIEADPRLLTQAISELLHNAARYTPHEGRISLSAELVHGELLITVRDTGKGIPEDLLPRVFDWLVRGEEGYDFSQGHIGVGLAMVRAVVTNHHGTVEAHSGGPGMGSEITLRLPLRQPAGNGSDEFLEAVSERLE